MLTQRIGGQRVCAVRSPGAAGGERGEPTGSEVRAARHTRRRAPVVLQLQRWYDCTHSATAMSSSSSSSKRVRVDPLGPRFDAVCKYGAPGAPLPTRSDDLGIRWMTSDFVPLPPGAARKAVPFTVPKRSAAGDADDDSADAPVLTSQYDLEALAVTGRQLKHSFYFATYSPIEAFQFDDAVAFLRHGHVLEQKDLFLPDSLPITVLIDACADGLAGQFYSLRNGRTAVDHKVATPALWDHTHALGVALCNGFAFDLSPHERLRTRGPAQPARVPTSVRKLRQLF